MCSPFPQTCAPVLGTEPLSATVPQDEGWTSRASAWLRGLSASPLTLLLATLALNALFWQIRHRYHDAVLYEFQVANRVEDNRFGDDLFFRHGSQDRYSLFSTLAAPPAALLGGPWAFFLLYLTGTALFFLGLQRLLHRLFANPRVTSLALLCLAVSPPVVGPQNILRVPENFTTPRLFATALVLLGLERMVAGRPVTALLLLAGAMSLHPLMAVGGLLLFAAWWLFRDGVRPWRLILVGLTGATALAVLLATPLGGRILGRMDPEWYEAVTANSGVVLWTTWPVVDKVRLFVAVAVALAAWPCVRDDPRLSRFAAALLTVSALAVLGTVLGDYLRLALFIQGQAFRSLWLIQVLQVPFGLLLIQRWWSAGTEGSRAAAVLLIAYWGLESALLTDLPLVSLAAVGVFALAFRGLSAAPRPGWLWKGLAAGLLAVAVVSLPLTFAVMATYWPHVTAYLDPCSSFQVVSFLIPPLCRLALGVGLLLCLQSLAGVGRLSRVLLAGTFLGLNSASFVLPQTPYYRNALMLHGDGLRLIERYLAGRETANGRPPTLYWSVSQVGYLWLELRVNSYYNIDQVVGSVFNRDTALEGMRRRRLAQPFEVDALAEGWEVVSRFEHDFRRPKAYFLSPGRTRPNTTFSEAGPAQFEDLLRLCQDEQLDYLVVRKAFPGWYDASDGGWFLYDCGEVRFRQTNSPPLSQAQAQNTGSSR